MATLIHPATTNSPAILNHELCEDDFQFKLQQLGTFVTVDRVKAHLRILDAFRWLIQDVNGGPVFEDPKTGDLVLSADAMSYLRSAFNRFLYWINSISESDTLQSVIPPPPDVLMVWHACLLNPCAMYEDSEARFPQLRVLLDFPVELIADNIDGETKRFIIPSDQASQWELVMKCVYNLKDGDPVLQDLPATQRGHCPQCTSPLDEDSSSSYDGPHAIDELDKTAILCSHCGMSVTKDSLCVRKLISDLSKYIEKGIPLPGTLLDHKGSVNFARARVVADEVVRLLGDPHELGKSVEWKMANVEEKLLSQPSLLRTSRIKDLLSPYMYPAPFSVDLLNSLIRQACFAPKLFSLSPSTVGASDDSLKEMIAMYGKFLELISIPGLGNMSPTYEIDLVWHTHQLNGHQYRSHMLKLCGKYIDHKDNLSVTARELANENRRVQWQMHFGRNLPITQPPRPDPDPDPSPRGPKPKPGPKPGPSCSGPSVALEIEEESWLEESYT